MSISSGSARGLKSPFIFSSHEKISLVPTTGLLLPPVLRDNSFRVRGSVPGGYGLLGVQADCLVSVLRPC